MPTEVIALPADWPGWNPKYLMNGGRPFGRPYDYYFPPNYLPAQYFNVVDSFANTLLDLPNASMLLAQFVFSPAAAAAFAQATAPIMYSATLKRIGSSASTSPDSGVYYVAFKSPRVGYQLGTHFKSQTYVTVGVTALGFVYNLANIVWMPNSSIVPRIEYRMNCRFRQFYVMNGKLTGVRADPANASQTQVQLFDSTDTPNFASPPNGSIKVIKSDGTSQTLSISSVDSQWWCTVATPNGSDGTPTAVSVAVGDFYVLSKPWLIEDPQLMFEYGLGVSGDGYYQTDYQKCKVTGNVIGMWLPPEGSSTLYVPYVDATNSDYMASKINIDSAAVAQQELEGISPTIAGDTAAGYAKFNALSPKPSTLRIIVRHDDPGIKHNFMAGNLVGEYLQAGDQYYEIVGQTRYDTVEIKDASITSSQLFSTIQPVQVTIVQQNFWKISEMYYESTKSPEGGTISAHRSLWQGRTTGASGSSMSWLTSADVNMGTTLPDSEKGASGYSTLAERIRRDVSIQGGQVAHAFKKGSGWVAVNIRTGTQYKCKSFSFSEADSEGFLTVTAEVDGDLSGSVSVGDEMGVAFDTPYDTFRGGARASNFNLVIDGAPALYSQGQYRMFMSGWYDSGSYRLAAPTSTDTELSLVDWSFGVDSSASAIGVPFLYASTKKRLVAVSFVEHGPLQRQCVYHTDPSIDALAFRSALPGWKDQIEQRLVKMGKSSIVTAGGVAPSHTQNVVTKAFFEFPQTSGGGDIPSYWFYIPGNMTNSVSPFFSVSITGNGGVKTAVSERYGVSTGETSASPVVLPFEYYAAVGSSGATSGVHVYYQYGEDSAWGGGLSVTDGTKLQTLLGGGTVASAAVSLAPASLEFTPQKNLLKGVNIFDPQTISEDTIFLLYGKDSPPFYAVGGSSTATANPSKPSVFAAMSKDAGETWSSPKYLSQSPSTAAEQTEWGVPQMLLYDFRYAGSVMDNDLSTCWIFGYGYTRDSSAASASTDGNLDYLFLGVYKFNLMSIPKDKSYEMKAKETPSQNLADGDVFAYYRPPHLQDSSETQSYYKIGDVGTAMTGTFPSDYGTPCSEKFVKIAGGTKSGAMITDLKFVEDVIGIVRDSSGDFTIHIRDEDSDGIVALRSPRGGDSWYIDVDAGKRVIYAKSGRAPHSLGDYFFFFDGDSLKCKRLGATVKGNYTGRQELLDAYPSVTVSGGTPSQRIAATQEKTGDVRAYVMTLGGYLTGRSSSNGGGTWTGLTNW
jgi:hypothetical protein